MFIKLRPAFVNDSQVSSTKSCAGAVTAVNCRAGLAYTERQGNDMSQKRGPKKLMWPSACCVLGVVGWFGCNRVTLVNQRPSAVSVARISIGDCAFVRRNIAPGESVSLFYSPFTGVHEGKRSWSLSVRFADGTKDGFSASPTQAVHFGERKVFKLGH